MKTVLTYGTFDLFHEGHKRILERAKELGDYLIVGVSTDEFNSIKGKKSVYSYEIRKTMVESQPCVDLVIPENTWDQKINDILTHHVDVVVMGSDWAGSDKFDYLKQYCNVIFLPRTPGISTTAIKEVLNINANSNDMPSIQNESNSIFEAFGQQGLSVPYEEVGGIIKIK